jgi:hypothetical protein
MRWVLEFTARSLDAARATAALRGSTLREGKAMKKAPRAGWYEITSTDAGWLAQLRDQLVNDGEMTEMRQEG